MSKVEIANVGVIPARRITIDELIEHVRKFPERKILETFRKWASKLQPSQCRIEGDRIELNSDYFSNPTLIEIALCLRVSETLKVWSAVKIMYLMCDRRCMDNTFRGLIENAEDTTVGCIQYKTRSRGLPQYLINHRNGTTKLAANFTEAVEIIATFKTKEQ